MARPAPIVLLEHIDPETYKAEQVLKAEYIYAIYYQNQPINLRTLNKIVSYPGPKYKKCSFSNSGHALHLAEKLNDMFRCNDFEVYRLVQGERFGSERQHSQN